MSVTVQSRSKGREIGEVVDFAGSAAPAGWLLCFGQNVNRTTYAALFAVLSTTYGAGDGSTTFGLPDLRGRVTAGKDDMGGSAASRITSGGQAAINGASLGAAGGAQDNTLDTTRIPAHAHGVTDPTHNHSQNAHQHFTVNNDSVTSGATGTTETVPRAKTTTGDSDYGLGGSGTAADRGLSSATTATNVAASTGISIQNAGGGGAHNNVQPTIVLNKMIYAGV